MWPWEHLAVAYLAYSALVHVREGRAPTAGQTVALALGSQFPDLVDKPLAWWLGVLPSGWSLTHSLLVAVPLCVVVLVTGRRVGRPTLASAFVLGYLLHLPGDAFYWVAFGDDPVLYFLVWPLLPGPSGTSTEFLPRVLRLFEGFVRLVSSPRGAWYVLGELLLVGGAFAVWLADGAPVGASLVDAVRARVARHSR